MSILEFIKKILSMFNCFFYSTDTREETAILCCTGCTKKSTIPQNINEEPIYKQPGQTLKMNPNYYKSVFIEPEFTSNEMSYDDEFEPEYIF